MTGGATVQPNPEEAAELEAAIARMIEEMDELRAIMAEDQAEIERLKAESERLKAETNALKEKSRAIQADTRRVLDALMAA
jgi:predicted RNase H-like nuclease (RuvC/YqgF family)